MSYLQTIDEGHPLNLRMSLGILHHSTNYLDPADAHVVVVRTEFATYVVYTDMIQEGGMLGLGTTELLTHWGDAFATITTHDTITMANRDFGEMKTHSQRRCLVRKWQGENRRTFLPEDIKETPGIGLNTWQVETFSEIQSPHEV